MPGGILGPPEYLRISLTASDEMIDRALPAVAALSEATTAGER